MASALMNTYARMDISFTHGERCYLVDPRGHRYLDAISGIGVNSLGHAHPAVTEAVAQQAARVIHTSNLYHIEQQERLGEALARISGLARSFIGNSGAEANEAAIKLARRYGHERGIANPNIIVMETAFHGRTMATLSATGNRKIQAGFEPLVGGFIRAPFGDIDAINTIAANNTDVCAILVEPIQGEGGIKLPPPGYLQALRECCDTHGWLLMLDEVQCGNCRTGTWYACQGEDVVPDVLTTAKALANGVPIGACMASGAAADTLQAGHHGSTYGGNPLACAAALAVIRTMEDEKLAEHAARMGAQLLSAFRERLGDLPGVTEVRGRGLMLGIELLEPCGELVERALAKGLLINVTAGNVVRLLPPLILDEVDAAFLVDTLSSVITDYLDAAAPALAQG
ncbi:MAG: aspartate aminotransferase family protein [Halieaceae bacterium]|jgi:acetylornithine aminotransferase|nr:aspartate aminotransferase family protein [Halieaceae bacterium]